MDSALVSYLGAEAIGFIASAVAALRALPPQGAYESQDDFAVRGWQAIDFLLQSNDFGAGVSHILRADHSQQSQDISTRSAA